MRRASFIAVNGTNAKCATVANLSNTVPLDQFQSIPIPDSVPTPEPSPLADRMLAVICGREPGTTGKAA